MKRSLMIAIVTTMTALGSSSIDAHAVANAAALNGRIVFTRYDVTVGGVVSYTMDPDGTHVQQLFFNGHSEWPHWSPDGTQIAIFCCDDGMAAHIVNPDTGSFRELAPVRPDLEEHCGFAWSPDGRRLSCGNFGLTEPRGTGIWTVRSSDGGGLRQITSNPGGEDNPGDFSPDGRRLVFVRNDADGEAIGLFVARIDGGSLRRITPRGMVLDGFGGSWSPTGNRILFVARTDADHRLAIWEVSADGSDLHQLQIAPSCGGSFSDPRSVSCFYPGWSPDGKRIVFTRVSAHGTQSNIAVVNADGSGLVQITHTGDADEADWGIHPLLG
jgi:Tol biopolymer transport system component